MKNLTPFINQVVCGDAIELFPLIPLASIDAVITDPMFGKKCVYDSGPDPAKGNPFKHWQYHLPFYQHCRRVLKPGGILAWAQGFQFSSFYDKWFGPHRCWTPLCRGRGFNFPPLYWVVQSKEQEPIEHPNNMLVQVDRRSYHPLKALHPCPKSVEEMIFLIESLTKPGQVILDCFCGLGSTLVAAEQLGRFWIGCDKSLTYCRWAMKRLAKAQ